MDRASWIHAIRTDLFHGFSLGTFDPASRAGSSPYLPPLTEIDQNGNLHPGQETHRFAQGAESLAAANIRFRYQPTMHVSETLRIHTTFDILDNLVLGSTPIGGPHAQRTLGAEADRYALADGDRITMVRDPSLVRAACGRRPSETCLG